MFISRHLRSTAAAAALILSLAACGASQSESPTASSETDPATASESPQPAASESAIPESADDTTEGAATEESTSAPAEESESAAGDEAAAEPASGTLLITLNGEETTFTPEIVRCNGEPGTIRNVVITMKNDELPLIKVTPGEFAIVKLDNRGEPEKSSSTGGITTEDGTITFDDASIGGAVVDGTVDCLQGNQG